MESVKYYSGVGSRETPPHVCSAMTAIATFLEDDGYVLRSGGAAAADSAFENGVKNPDNKMIFLPESGWRGNDSPYFGICDRAIQMALEIHPAPDKLKDFGRAAHGRNCYQVLGRNFDEPSEFVLCWTPDAIPTGGTRTAIKLAQKNKIPLLNFGLCDSEQRCLDVFQQFYLLYG